MLVAVSLFAFVGVFVAFLTIEVARQAQTSISMIPAELAAYRAMDRMRNELLPASSRDIVFDVDGAGVTFTNPARARRMRFEFADGSVLFNPDMSVSPARLITISPEHADFVDVRFAPMDAIDRRRIQITVSARSSAITTINEDDPDDNRRLFRDRVTTYSDIITLRN
jgi:hypothetical protein